MATTRRLVSCGLLSPPMFVAGYLMQDALKPGFDPSRQFISHLSVGPYGWVNSVLLVVTGGLVVLFALGLRQALHRRHARPIWMAVLVFGASIAVAGLFPIDPGLGYPPGALRVTTWHGRLHDAAGGVAFVSIVTATVMSARRLRGTQPWSTGVHVSYAAAVVIVVLFVATSALAALDYAGTPGPTLAGLAERAYLTTAFAWIFVIARRAASELDPGGDRAMVASVRRP